MNGLQRQTESVKALLARAEYKARFQEVLGQRAPQFMASISNAAQLPGLARCEPKSVLAAAFVAATLDLPIDRNLGFAWIIPYKTNIKEGNAWREVQVAQFQMGARGWVQLAIRTGQYARMNAFLVNKEALKGLDDCGEPEIDFSKLDESKETVGYGFVWKLTNGFRKVVYWSKEKVLAHAGRYSQAYRAKKKDSPWVNNFDAMALKTVVKNSLAKWGVLSVQMQQAAKHDAAAQIDVESEVMPTDALEGLEMGDPEGEPETPPDAPDGSSTPPEGEKQAVAPKAVEGDSKGKLPTPQEKLSKTVIDAGFNWDEFAKYAQAEGHLADASSLPGFEAVPTKIAERLLRATIGLIQGLTKARLE